MTFQLLVASVNKKAIELIKEMNIHSNAIIISQESRYYYEQIHEGDFVIDFFATAERGVGLSRNQSLLRSKADISLFADEDIVYQEKYQDFILKEFEKHPEADVLLFNVTAAAGRETYHIEKYGRVHWYNCGRYPTYSMAIRTQQIHKKNITFSLLFGGGAKYSNGEDSLFIQECIKKGLKVYATPVLIGQENGRESTWFKGYNSKFFFDRGVLYQHLYGWLAKPMAIRFLYAHRKEMCQTIPIKKAYFIMTQGIKEGK